MAASYESLLLSSTESYLKKNPSRLLDESQLKDRLLLLCNLELFNHVLWKSFVPHALPQNFQPLS